MHQSQSCAYIRLYRPDALVYTSRRLYCLATYMNGCGRDAHRVIELAVERARQPVDRVRLRNIKRQALISASRKTNSKQSG